MLFGHIIATVINFRLGIDVDTLGTSGSGLIEQLARERVLSVKSKIVVCQVDDLVARNAVLEHDPDGVM